MDNIFYFKRISAIGGTEQFLYEIAKKYYKYDITVFFDDADPKQLKRLRSLVRCVKHQKGKIVKCNKAFFNFNIDMIDDVEANDYYFISHAIYQELGYKPPIHHPKLNHFIAVSQYATEKLNDYARLIGREIKGECCYNPLTLEPVKKVVKLISATRLEDKTKGGQRTFKLIEALDRYCLEHDRQYLWLIFTNNIGKKIESPNVVLMQGRIDIRPYIADSDYLVQLSNNMETYCYSINEALGYGTRVVTTPLTVLNEFPITDEMMIEAKWDMSNVDDVVKQIFESKPKKFKYSPPSDRWDEILGHEPSAYEPNKKVRVKATEEYRNKNILDKELMMYPPKDYEWDVDIDRYEELVAFTERTGIKLVEVVS